MIYRATFPSVVGEAEADAIWDDIEEGRVARDVKAIARRVLIAWLAHRHAGSEREALAAAGEAMSLVAAITGLSGRCPADAILEIAQACRGHRSPIRSVRERAVVIGQEAER